MALDLHADIAEILSEVSRRIVIPHYQNLQSTDIEEKSPGDLVTVADKLSEAFLSEQLSKLIPTATVVGEEAVAADPAIMHRLNDDLVWIIDPIDGTGNFAAGHSPFGILIALAEKGQTVAGWLYDPLTNRLCHARKGEGAFIGSDMISESEYPISKPVAALATGFMTESQRKAVLQRAEAHYQIVDIPRCAAEQYPRLVLGTNHISVFERTLPWDHAAGVLFLNEAGGKAGRWDGTPYLPGDGRTGMLGASSPKLWEEAAELLGDIFAV